MNLSARLKQKLNKKSNKKRKEKKMELKIYFEKLPDETVTNILVLATTTTKQTIDTYHSLFRTCRILSTILEQRQREILPRYPTYVYVRKILKYFVQCSVVSKPLQEIIQSKN